MQLTDLAVKVAPRRAGGPREGERGLIVGASGSGKSTLLEFIVRVFVRMYWNLQGHVLILDSKPRFRAEWEVTGVKATRRYKKWDHGAYIPGSFVLDLKRPGFGLNDAWKLGARVVIAQTDDPDEFPLLLAVALLFFKASRANRPQLLVVDEVGDFYRTGGHPIGRNHVILRTVRAGRERGLAFLGGSQRSRGIPAQLVSELSKLYLFRLDHDDDIDHLESMGLPEHIPVPDTDEVFWYYVKRTRVGKLLRLRLPQHRTEGVNAHGKMA